MADPKEKEKVEKKQITTNIGWQEVLTSCEKRQGIPKKTIQEAFTAVEKEIKVLFTENVPKKSEITLIKTPLVAYALDRIPKHIETDKKGQQWDVSESIRMVVTPPQKFIEIANEGFTLTRKQLKD